MFMYSDMFGFADSGRFAATFMVIYFAFIFLMYVYSIAAYIFYSLGLYTIAMRRGIRHSWLAWIPVGSDWILGSIADQYQYVAKGRVKNRRKALLGLTISIMALLLALFVMCVVLVVSAINVEFNMAYDESQLILPAIIMLVISLVMMVVALITTVYQYVCLYNLFESCNPDHGTTFLVLSIFFSFLLPFFVFAVRKKDLGMPPKKTEVSAPVFQPVTPEPVAEPVYAEFVAEPDDFAEE